VVGSLSAYFLKDYLFPPKSPKVAVSSVEKVDDSMDNKSGGSEDIGNEVDSGDVGQEVVEGVIEDEPSGLPRDENDDDIDLGIDEIIDVDNDGNNGEAENRKVDPSDIQIIPYAQDKDRDTMTDVEEALYGTNVNIGDTDSDGFLDGQEIANLYDPTKKGSAEIIDSDLIKIYTNPLYKYSIFYPSSWRVVPLSGGDQEITFVSGTKEFIEVAVMDNPSGLTASDWYLEQIPKNLTEEVETVWANNFQGVKSLDNMHVYLTPITGEKNFIYHISYMVGSQTNISYPGTFKMMVSSFDFR